MCLVVVRGEIGFTHVILGSFTGAEITIHTISSIHVKQPWGSGIKWNEFCGHNHSAQHNDTCILHGSCCNIFFLYENHDFVAMQYLRVRLLWFSFQITLGLWSRISIHLTKRVGAIKTKIQVICDNETMKWLHLVLFYYEIFTWVSCIQPCTQQ